MTGPLNLVGFGLAASASASEAAWSSSPPSPASPASSEPPAQEGKDVGPGNAIGSGTTVGRVLEGLLGPRRSRWDGRGVMSMLLEGAHQQNQPRLQLREGRVPPWQRLLSQAPRSAGLENVVPGSS